MSVKNNLEIILNELKQNSQIVNDNDFQNFIKEIVKAHHIYLLGKGRSGLIISAFANRLMHLGFSVSLVGEITSPHSKSGDLLIIGSGSGETPSLVSIAQTAKDEQVRVALITINENSTIASLADSIVVLPGASKLSGKSKQPMASAFEQLSFLVYEAIEYRRKNSELKIRVVKRNYIYYDELEMRQVQEMTYFTNLPKEEFEKRKMEDLYSKRWDIEVAYKTLKTQLELERNVSTNV